MSDKVDQARCAIEPELFTVDDVARLLRVSRRTVFRMRARGLLPPPVRMSRRIVRWLRSDLQQYVGALTYEAS